LRLVPRGVRIRGMGEDGSTSLARAIAVLMVLGSGECAGGEGLGVVQIARLVGKGKTQGGGTRKGRAGAGVGVAGAAGVGGRVGGGDREWGVAAVPAGVAVVHAGGDGGRSAVAGVDAACAAGAGGAGAGVRAPVGAGWLWPVDVVVGEPAVGDSGGAVGGPD